MELFLCSATVVNINDVDRLGKIQIRIEPMMNDETNLPWAIPFVSEVSNSTMSNNLPSVDSKVWILRDKYWKKFYYISNRYFYGMFDFSKIEKLLNIKDSNGNPLDKTYKNIQFNLYEDGGLSFHNNNDGSNGFIHKNGSYSVIDKNGGLVISSKSNMTVDFNGKVDISNKSDFDISTQKFNLKSSQLNLNANGDVSLQSTTIGRINIGNKTNSLGKFLQEMCTNIMSITTIDGKTANPAFISAMTTLIAKINLFLS